MQTDHDPLDLAVAAIVDLLVDADTNAAITAALTLDERTHRLMIGILSQVVSGTVAQFADSRSMPYEDAVATLMAIVRETVADNDRTLAQEY